jgi:DnaJ-class molecular chaperone
MNDRVAMHDDYPCPECNGQGWVVVAAHARDSECYADRHTNCPVQEQEQCSTCGGHGAF